MVHLAEDACQIVGSLSGNVVEVDTVTNTVHDCEEEGIESNDLVETDVRVEWNVVVEDGLPEVCLLYTSPSPRDATLSRMPSSA